VSPSSEHSNVALDSFDENSKVAKLRFVGLVGVLSNVVSGVIVSTVQV